MREEELRVRELGRSYNIARMEAGKAKKAASSADVAKARQQIQEARAARATENWTIKANEFNAGSDSLAFFLRRMSSGEFMGFCNAQMPDRIVVSCCRL